MTDTEEWRPIPGHPFYEASNLGRIRSLPRIVTRRDGSPLPVKGRIMKSHPGGPGKLHLFTGVGSERPSVQVHILVCTTFHGPRPSPKHEVAHWDGNGFNNNATNLRWATRKENVADTARHGTQSAPPHSYGREHPRPKRKLSEDDVLEIRRLLGLGVLGQSIAKRYRVHYKTVSDIKLGKTWAWLQTAAPVPSTQRVEDIWRVTK